jgi:hypothetical protein
MGEEILRHHEYFTMIGEFGNNGTVKRSGCLDTRRLLLMIEGYSDYCSTSSSGPFPSTNFPEQDTLVEIRDKSKLYLPLRLPSRIKARCLAGTCGSSHVVPTSLERCPWPKPWGPASILRADGVLLWSSTRGQWRASGACMRQEQLAAVWRQPPALPSSSAVKAFSLSAPQVCSAVDHPLIGQLQCDDLR